MCRRDVGEGDKCEGGGGEVVSLPTSIARKMYIMYRNQSRK